MDPCRVCSLVFPWHTDLARVVCGGPGSVHKTCLKPGQTTCVECQQPLRTRLEIALEREPTEELFRELDYLQDDSLEVIRMCERVLQSSEDSVLLERVAFYVWKAQQWSREILADFPGLIEALMRLVESSKHAKVRQYARAALTAATREDSTGRVVTTNADFLRKVVWFVKHPRAPDDFALVCLLWNLAARPSFADAFSADAELIQGLLVHRGIGINRGVSGFLANMVRHSDNARRNLRTPTVLAFVETHRASSDTATKEHCEYLRTEFSAWELWDKIRSVVSHT